MADPKKKYDNAIDQAFADEGFEIEYVDDDEDEEGTTMTFRPAVDPTSEDAHDVS